MIWNDALQTILNDVLRETTEDLVGLWLVRALVRRAFPRYDYSSSREATLSIVAKSIASGRVVAGEFKDEGFEIWADQSLALKRAEERWPNDGSDPDLSTNVWLSGHELNYRPIRLR
jgi:hypothetical protein